MDQPTTPTFLYQTTEEALFAMSNFMIQQQAMLQMHTALLAKLFETTSPGVSEQSMLEFIATQNQYHSAQATAMFKATVASLHYPTGEVPSAEAAASTSLT